MQKKNAKKGSKYLNFTNLKTLFLEFQKASKLSKEDIIKLLKLFELQRKLKISPENLSKLIEEIQIPISVFKTDLAPLETLVKYLKENLNFSFTKIASLLNRDPRTIWSSYNASFKKLKKKLIIEKSPYSIPIPIFSNRKFSILESLVYHLKSQQLSFKQISTLLQKDYQTIWTVYQRAKKKYAK